MYALSAFSSTSGCEESSCSGAVSTLCSVCTASTIIAASSSPGRPTFTSKISAPASTCSIPWLTRYSISWASSACFMRFFPVGLILSPIGRTRSITTVSACEQTAAAGA